MKEASLPQEWQEITEYSLRVGWLHTKPTPSQLELQEAIKENDKNASLEIVGHPGWWLHSYVVAMVTFETLDDALASAKSTLKNSDLNGAGFGLEDALSKAPAKLSKSQRVKLIDEIMHEPKEKHEGLVREAFLQEGDYALSVWIEELSFRPDFEAAFVAPENPLRSFVDKAATIYSAPLVESEEEDELDLGDFEAEDDPDMEDLSEEEMIEAIGALERMKDVDADADWQEVARGVVRLEGNTLLVGEWQCVIPDEALVYGAAFESASFDLVDKQLSILIELEQKHE